MPITPTYPGVYIEELPSGVRTITSVATSVTAFIGGAKRGPINKAIRIQSFAAFERKFGGLDDASEMSFAVRQFFVNGGSEAWVVRVAKNAQAATLSLKNDANTDVLEVAAVSEGRAGNLIRLRVDYNTPSPASTFNLSAQYGAEGDADSSVETFPNLSMNSKDPRFVETVIRDGSQLITAKRAGGLTAGLGAGTSISGEVADVGTVVTPTRSQLQIRVNNLPPVAIDLKASDVTGANPAARLATLCTAIQTQVVAAAAGNGALANFKCVPDGSRIKMTSGATGEESSVRVLPGVRNDVAAGLRLGAANGGTESDAVATIRPAQVPRGGSLTGEALGATALDALPTAAKNALGISIDGYGPDVIELGPAAAAGANLAAKLADVAARLQTAVREKRTSEAYRKFTAGVTAAGDALVLTSGTRGKDSRVRVSAAPANSIADDLKLLANPAVIDGADLALQNGSDDPFTDADANLIIANRNDRKGLFALEDVDLFNILCLPGVSEPGVLVDADAYCKERRAFLIVDPPKTVKSVEDMEKLVQGAGLPKSDHAAVFYPWVYIPNPLDGRLRQCAPSGSVAGVFARTDATRGVWKAPAGIEATVAGALKIDPLLTDGENGVLNPLGVNCIRMLPVYGGVVWGARTLRGADAMASEWKYIPVRRLALLIEESLFRGTHWVVFEGNDEPLWAQIRLNVGAFMHTLFRQGAFQGKTPRDAYFVKCDAETTTPDDQNRGVVNILAGFAPLKPAEFVFIRIQQKAGQIQV